jgi:hypothetical protein
MHLKEGRIVPLHTWSCGLLDNGSAQAMNGIYDREIATELS